MSIEDKRKSMLDKLFRAFSITSEGSYVYVTDLKTGLSRWAKEAVEYFDLSGEYMSDAGEQWAELVHPDDREMYDKDIGEVFSGQKDSHDLQYRASSRDGSYVVVACHGVIITDVDDNPDFFAGAIVNYGIQNSRDSVTGLKNLYGFFNDLKNHRVEERAANVML
ncbi:MAG: PAS domain-containing protein, partial [Lachnospiraceae bacterium]|nr:PAS domain-containing protein [Lachnospiraceae bacterium]